MKTKLFIVALFCSVVSWGQVVTFTPTSTTGVTATNSTSTIFAIGSGLTAGSSCSGSWYQGTAVNSTTNSTSNATSNNDFYEFTVTPNSGYQLNLTQITASGLRSSGTGPQSVEWGYKIGTGSFIFQGTATTPGSGNCSSTGNSNIWDFADFSTNQSVTFRLYFSNASAATGTYRIGTVTLDGTVTSGCTAPTTQANTFTTGTLTASSAVINWARGSGDNVLVVARATSAVATDPSSGTAYTANAAFGLGTQIGTGNFVVYNGTGTSVNVTGLSANTTYHFAVYEFNNTGTCYNTTELTGNITTLCAAPTTQATFGTITPTTTTASVVVVAGNGSGRLVKINTTNSFSDPTNGTSYTANLNYAGGEQVVGAGTTSPLNITGLTANTTYYVAVYEYNCTGTGIVYNMVENASNFTTAALTPSIAVSATAAQAHNSTYTYANTGIEVNNDVTFTITNSGSATLIISSIVVTGATYSLQGTAPTNVAAGGTATFTVRFTPTAIGTQAGSITINSNATPAAYIVNLTGNGVGNASSHIVVDTSFTYPTNIPYINYLGSDVTFANSIEVGRFIAYDGNIGTGDSDALPTILSSMTFAVTNAFNLSRVALYDTSTNTEIAEVAGGSTPISFSSLAQSIPDNGSKTYSIRVLFNTTVTDNDQIKFSQTLRTPNTNGTATSSAFVASEGSSQATSVSGDDNRIEVVADRLTFSQQPSNTSINVSMSPAVTISAGDLYGNRDLDYTSTINITSTGTMSSTPITAAAVSGFATFSAITHTATGTGLTLNATSGSLTAATSTAFDIVSILYLNGDYRTTGTGTWLSNNASPAIWERYDSSTTTWAISNSPNYATTNNVYIRNGHIITTGGSFGTTVKIIIESGGVLAVNHSCTTASLIVKEGGELDINASLTNNGTFEVEDNADVFVNFSFGTPSTSIWKGTENFHPNSNFTFNDWDCANDNLVTSDTVITTNTYNGYEAAFGNIIFDFGTNLSNSDDWILLSSGVTKNLAHGYLWFYSNDTSGADIRVSTTGTVTSGIGGDFYVDDNYLSTQVINMKTSGTLNFTIKGNLKIDSATVRVLASSATSSSTLNVEGNIIITPSGVLTFNSSSAADATSIINLKGDLTCISSGSLTSSNTANIGQFNFAGTGDGLTPATTQTIDIASTGTNENKNISFNVNNGAYVQLANNNFDFNTTNLNVLTGGVFNNGGEYQITSASGTNTITVSGRFITQDQQGFNGNNAAIPAITPTLSAGSYVEFARAGDQTVTNFTPKYKNVDITGTGTKTLGHATDVWVDENLRVLGSTLLVNNNEAVTVNKKVTVTAPGIFDIKNSGSLIQIDDTSINTGSINYERKATVNLYDYVYWSSPTIDFNMNGVQASYRYAWNPTGLNSNGGQGNWYPVVGNMETGKGYIFRVPNSYSTTSTPDNFTANFTGVPFNGFKSIEINRGNDFTGNGLLGIPRTISDDNWNLLGNPYPSAIGVNEFLNLNPDLEGFVYVWTHGDAPDDYFENPFYSSYTYNYDPNDYITINKTGTTSGPADYKIGAGQGFFVLMKSGDIPNTPATANVIFNNSIRSKDFDNTQFYRVSSNSPSVNDNSRLWLDLNSSQTSTRILIGYVSEATNDFDRMFDAFTENKNVQNFYSLISGGLYRIQGRALPFDVNDTVPLGFNAPASGSFSIGLANVDGLFTSSTQDIYLEDLELGIIHDLRVNPYSFNATQGIHNSRFVLRYTNSVLGNEDFIDDTNTVFVVSNESLTVSSLKENIATIEIYDVLGRKLYQNKNVNTQSQIVNSIQKTNSGLIIYITLENGIKVTKKIVF